MNRRLIHYGRAPITEPIRPTGRGYAKPTGFWFSVEGKDDWPSWCIAEDWHTADLACAHVLALSPTARICWIKGAAMLDAFDREYGRDNRNREIQWERVAAKFDGIVIAPYLWSRRLIVDWYYGWDCASGCIWNVQAIAGLRVEPGPFIFKDAPTQTGASP